MGTGQDLNALIDTKQKELKQAEDALRDIDRAIASWTKQAEEDRDNFDPSMLSFEGARKARVMESIEKFRTELERLHAQQASEAGTGGSSAGAPAGHQSDLDARIAAKRKELAKAETSLARINARIESLAEETKANPDDLDLRDAAGQEGGRKRIMEESVEKLRGELGKLEAEKKSH